MRMCHFRVQDDPFVPNKCLFLQTIIITFIYLLAFFIVQNLKQIFLWKFINIIFIYLLAPFIVQNLKKNSSSRSRVMRIHNLWAQNGPFAQMRTFSKTLLTSLVPIIYAYLQAKNQSQILIY